MTCQPYIECATALSDSASLIPCQKMQIEKYIRYLLRKTGSLLYFYLHINDKDISLQEKNC